MTGIQGLIAATFTPMHADGTLALERLPDALDQAIERGVEGFYVCGSTGEGPSLSVDERMRVAAASVEATRGRVPVIVQVGTNALPEARALAEHARSIGADAISATPPTYFKPHDADTLVDVLAHVVEPARGMPFFYYHIPAISGVQVDAPTFLPAAAERIAGVAGIKFSSPALHEVAAIDRDRFTVLFGVDEMLLAGLAMGAHGAVGSTYNLMAPLAREILRAHDDQDMHRARTLQDRYTAIVRTLVLPRSQPSLKAAMAFRGVDMGPARLPLRALSAAESADLEGRLTALGALDEFARPLDVAS